jgi:hypothetical protein
LDAARSATTFEQTQAAKLLVDTIKWSAGKRNPRVYGEHIDTTLTIADPVAEQRRQELRNELIARLQRMAKAEPLG